MATLGSVATRIRDTASTVSAEVGIPRFAVIPTKGNRRENLDKLIDLLASVLVEPIVIDTTPHKELVTTFAFGTRARALVPKQAGVNISAWWNLGLVEAEILANVYYPLQSIENGWDVAVLNDDCLPPSDWFNVVSNAMRSTGSVAGCTGHRTHTVRTPGPISLWDRMTGYAFMLRGEAGLRFDESMRWWYSDDDMDWQARKAGGMTMVGGYTVKHLYPNGQMSHELNLQAASDRANFVSKWGQAPW